MSTQLDYVVELAKVRTELLILNILTTINLALLLFLVADNLKNQTP